MAFSASKRRQTSCFEGIRSIVGIPSESIDEEDRRFHAFIRAVGRMADESGAPIVNTSSRQSMEASCPGGMAFLYRKLRRSSRDCLDHRWIDCGHLWRYYDPSRRCTVRSALHLYRSLERLLSRYPGKEVFLLRPGSPYIGDELVSLWLIRNRYRVRIYDAPSPLETAADLVETAVLGARGVLQRCCLSGPEFVDMPLRNVSALQGIIILRSLENAYARYSSALPVSSAVLNKVRTFLNGNGRAFLCHIGLHRYIVPCSAEDMAVKWHELNALCSPWTIIVVQQRRHGKGAVP